MSEFQDPDWLADSLRYWQDNLAWHRFVLGKHPSNTQVQYALGQCRTRRAQLRNLLKASK
jgi:hypothetical protein